MKTSCNDFAFRQTIIRILSAINYVQNSKGFNNNPFTFFMNIIISYVLPKKHLLEKFNRMRTYFPD